MIEYTVKVYDDGSQKWYLNGKRHREDGPAYVGADGHKTWWVDGKLHREDGPAIVWADGHKEWWVNGKQLSEKQFNARNADSCDGKIVEIDGKTYKLTEVK